MWKAVFIIATILCAVVLASQNVDEQHKHHRHQHSSSLAEHKEHAAGHITPQLHSDEDKNHFRHVALKPHDSKAKHKGRRHKAPKGAKTDKGTKHQQRLRKSKSHKKHGHVHGHGGHGHH
ncbi:maker81 [Drosophila busckii]|uniref:Maker81 n=1 Tax=Drosophila busckii TaxID=30019 RepID=A0A0M4EEY1_DROBS|nr:protein zntC [Drosophila busckii]ALC41801.1 maker81 [Drosophila busckii]